MASATVSCMCSSLTPRRVGPRKWGANRSKHHKNRSNVVTFYAPYTKTTHDPETRNTNGTTQLFSKQNLAWWSHYPKLLPHKKQSLGSCGLRLTKGLKQTALGSAVSCVASTLFFPLSQLTQAQTRQHLPFRQENKAHIIYSAQDEMGSRGHYEGGSAQVHLSMQRTRQHGECVGLRQHLLAALIKLLIKFFKVPIWTMCT